MQTGVLCYPIIDEEMLLIRKTRGHGEGKLVGPGGKVEPGESPKEAAVRETKEEVGVEVTDLTKVGELEFVFGEESFMYCHVFRAVEIQGETKASDEGIPRWFPLNELPYEEMWDGDEEWLPLLIEGQSFEGTLQFDADGEELRDSNYQIV